MDGFRSDPNEEQPVPDTQLQRLALTETVSRSLVRLALLTGHLTTLGIA